MNPDETLPGVTHPQDLEASDRGARMLAFVLVSAALCAIWFAAGIALGMHVLRSCP